jgi:5-formyltetrahydrofolate cyclo-ligase
MHPILTVGLAFAAQEIERVPAEDHDRRLDVVVTEAEVIRPRTET